MQDPHTQDSTSICTSNMIIKFADDTIVGLISYNDERAIGLRWYIWLTGVRKTTWSLTPLKTKEMVDFNRTKEEDPFPRHIHTEEVESEFFGVYESKQLTRTSNTSYLVKRAQQRLLSGSSGS